MIAVGVFAPLLAVAGYLVIALFLLIPIRALRRNRPSATGAP